MTSGRGPTGADWESDPVQPTPWSGPATGWGAAGRGSAAQPGAGASAVGGTSGPPSWMLVLAVIIPLATVPLLFVSVPLWVNIAGWAVAIFGSLGFLTAFTVVDLRRRTSRWYVDQPGLLASLRIAALTVGLVAAGCQAYLIADAVARLDLWAA